MPLQRLHRNPPQVGASLSSPRLLPQPPHRPAKHPLRQPHRLRRHGQTPAAPIIPTSHPIARPRIPNHPTPQIQPTHHTMPQFRHPSHQPIHPQRKVCHRHPHPPYLHLVEHRQRQSKHRILGSPIRQRLFDHLRDHLQRSRPCIINRP